MMQGHGSSSGTGEDGSHTAHREESSEDFFDVGGWWRDHHQKFVEIPGGSIG